MLFNTYTSAAHHCQRLFWIETVLMECSEERILLGVDPKISQSDDLLSLFTLTRIDRKIYAFRYFADGLHSIGLSMYLEANHELIEQPLRVHALA